VKTCGRCKQVKPESEFHRANRERSGLTSYCKPCGTAAANEWRIANVERYNARRRARYAADPTVRAAGKKWRQANKAKVKAHKKGHYARHREQVLARQKAYRIENGDEVRRRQRARANPEAQRIRSRRWYELNRERAAALAREWRKAHPEAQRERVRRRRARLRGATVERVDYAAVLERDGLRCYLCDTGIRGPIDFDHIIPIARGGQHSYANIAVTHARCNRRKRDLLVEELPWATQSARDHAKAISTPAV
jgi:5-methylcytosine-specific restriction endonuclease McrA